MRKAMSVRGVERSDLARMTGFTHGAVTAWFTGERNPTVDKLREICKALDVSADYLLGLKEEMK